jgi:predicted GTPase
MSYLLRSTSYVGNHLDRELAKRGAHTSGSTERKQARLQRFMDVEDKLQWVIQNEQNKVHERQITRVTELVYEAIREIIHEKGVEGSVSDVQDLLMQFSPEIVARVHAYAENKVTKHNYNLRSTQ